MRPVFVRQLLCVAMSVLLCSCGQGSTPATNTTSTSTAVTANGTTTTTTTAATTNLYSAPAQASLSITDVQTVIAAAVAEANARSKPATIAVVDRVGNVLAVYTMKGALATATLTPAASGKNTDAQGLVVPAAAAAISMAITGAYLSSGGNAFSTRTASEIVQQHFPPTPASNGLGGGPLFGVQFSQLPCSDLSQRYSATASAASFIGPKRSPLGLAAAPGGFPLYKSGVVVGGVGVMADGVYGYDTNIQNITVTVNEAIAFAAMTPYAAPSSITADQISVGGNLLQYSDVTSANLMTNPNSAPAYSTFTSSTGALTPVTGYFGGTIIAGQVYGTEASGVRAATTAEFNNPDAYILTNGSGAARFPISGGSDAGDVASPLTASEVTTILQQAFTVMSSARAQIRQPLNSRAQVTISVVDTRGKVLGMVRAPDAPIFGIDVSLQKARTAAFFSGPKAASDLAGNPSADVQSFVAATRTFLNMPTALTGVTAYSNRGIANLSRPFFPDGQDSNPNGPLSRPIAQWSPFSTGLQSALILTNVAQHLSYVTGASATDTAARCTFIPDAATGQNRLQNGIQIFAGSFPIYRGNVLVGAVGASGDGTSQDDMISFLGLYNAGQSTGTLGEAPVAIRDDQISVTVNGQSSLLTYANCPPSPFLDNTAVSPCDGK
jgi:uncharacterized protein GlcG (DUF336 family)